MGYIGQDEELEELDLQPIPDDIPAPAEPAAEPVPA